MGIFNLFKKNKNNKLPKKFIFNVNGIDYENDEGYIIKQILEEICNNSLENNLVKEYDGYTNKYIKDNDLVVYQVNKVHLKNIEIIKDIYNKKECYKIYINSRNKKLHVGWIPKSKIISFNEIYHNINKYKIDGYLSGGKRKYYDIDDNGNMKLITNKNKSYEIKINIHK